jgi:uncharacterized protein (DUF2141 family)
MQSRFPHDVAIITYHRFVKICSLHLILLFVVEFGFCACLNYPANEAEVDVIIKNIRNPKGVFVISFYDDANSFPKPAKDVLTQRVAVNDTLPHTVHLKLPAAKWYALAMFQDEDESGKIKQDKIGIPLEAYAFSNNVHPEAKAPSFTACKFFVAENGNKPIEINLIQPIFLRKKK